MKVLVWFFASVVIVLTILEFPLRKELDEAHKYQYAKPFSSAEVGGKVKRACGDCHSNETNWPWYSYVPPVSGWIHKHVREGQRELNFSDWETYSKSKRRRELESICGVISSDRMPPASYTLLHPQATLSIQEKKAICSWANSDVERDE